MRARWIASGILCVAAGAFGLSVWSWMRAPPAERSSAVLRDHAKESEARVAVTEIAWGIALCAERAGSLPPSSAKVPPALERVGGKQYQSRSSDWTDTAFACTGFHMLRPQRFLYQWIRAEDREGHVLAEGDFDGDGVVDHRVRLHVRCARDERGLRCEVERMATEPFAPVADPRDWE